MSCHSPLPDRFGHQRQITGAKGPLFIADIAQITLSLYLHTQLIAGMQIHCTDYFLKKLSAGSKERA
jgi:hypothetical protein